MLTTDAGVSFDYWTRSGSDIYSPYMKDDDCNYHCCGIWSPEIVPLLKVGFHVLSNSLVESNMHKRLDIHFGQTHMEHAKLCIKI